MAKVKVRVLNAIVDGAGKGEVISVEEKSAKHLEKIGYVERVASKQSAAKDDKDESGGGDK